MAGLDELAVAFKTGVLFKNTSFSDAFVYAVVPFVRPSFDGEAKPSISPSEIRSRKVANCLLCKVSGVLVGCLGGGGGGGPPAPLINLGSFVLLVPAQCLFLHLLQHFL